MHSHIHTISFRGIDTIPVSVQVHLSNGLPAMAIVGLADKAVGESRERVRAALSSLGLALPAKRIAVNLLPADIVLAPDIKRLLEEAMTKQKLSARGFHKVLRVAQTIADLERSETLQRHHVLEALSYRGVLLSGPLPG
jgi:predicted ATPase with chaperone activity